MSESSRRGNMYLCYCFYVESRYLQNGLSNFYLPRQFRIKISGTSQRSWRDKKELPLAMLYLSYSFVPCYGCTHVLKWQHQKPFSKYFPTTAKFCLCPPCYSLFHLVSFVWAYKLKTTSGRIVSDGFFLVFFLLICFLEYFLLSLPLTFSSYFLVRTMFSVIFLYVFTLITIST